MAEWIEIRINLHVNVDIMSPLAMAEWIEIKNSAVFPKATQVSASDGGVD